MTGIVPLGDRSRCVVTTATERRLRILLLPPQPWLPAPGEVAGIDTPNFEMLFTQLARRGIDTDLLNPLGWPWNPLAGRHALYTGLDPLRGMRVLLTKRRYDAIVAISESPTVLPLLLRRLLRFRPPVIAIDMALAAGWRLRERVLAFAFPRVDGAVVLGRNQIEQIGRHWPTRAPLRFIPLQIDTQFFQPEPPSPNGPILTVGDDVARDFPTLLRALDGLDVDLVAKTRQLRTSDAGLPRVRVIANRMRWRDYRRLFAEARFVMVPLTAAPHASGVNSVLEAMAMGKALITCDSPGIRDYVLSDRTALVVPCGDAAAMRVAAKRLLTDDALCARLGTAARSFVESHCSYAAVAEQTAGFIREVIARKSHAN